MVDILLRVRAYEGTRIYGWDVLGDPCAVQFSEAVRVVVPRVGRPYCFRHAHLDNGHFVLTRDSAMEEVFEDDFRLVEREVVATETSESNLDSATEEVSEDDREIKRRGPSAPP
eukprot:3874306-Prorocentrum_lima.AAC.1